MDYLEAVGPQQQNFVSVQPGYYLVRRYEDVVGIGKPFFPHFEIAEALFLIFFPVELAKEIRCGPCAFTKQLDLFFVFHEKVEPAMLFYIDQLYAKIVSPVFRYKVTVEMKTKS